MNERCEELINPAEFTEDEPVEFAAVEKDQLPGPIEAKYWVHISERLWFRLLSYGAAYELHFQQAIEPVIDSVFGPEQCESLGEELEFLIKVANDPALSEALAVILTEVGKVVNRPSMCLVISPP